MSTEKLHVYTICFPAYDSTTQLHGCLYNIRRNFFENGVSEKKVITDYIGENCTKYSYYISQWGMGWKKTVDGKLLEYSVPERDGCSILFQDSDSHHYAKIIYDTNLDWVKTYYYDRNSDSQIPAHSVELVDERGVLMMRSYDEAGNPKSSLKLYPGYSDMNSEINDLLDKESGKPIIYATTNRGEVCFCTAEQARLRGTAMEHIEPSAVEMDLEEVMVSTYDWDEREAQLFAECVLLLRGADAEPDELDRLTQAVVSESSQDVDIQAEYERTVRETEEWIRQLSRQPVYLSVDDPSEDTNELYSYSSAYMKEHDDDLSEILSLINHLEEKNKQTAEKEAEKKPLDSEGVSLYEQLETLRTSGQKMPTRYTVAGRKGKAKMVHATEVFDHERGNQAG